MNKMANFFRVRFYKLKNFRKNLLAYLKTVRDSFYKKIKI